MSDLTSDLTPYDTGERLEPQPWGPSDDVSHYGKVDFDNEESATVATVYIEATPEGTYRLVVDTDFEMSVVINGHQTLTR